MSKLHKLSLYALALSVFVFAGCSKNATVAGNNTGPLRIDLKLSPERPSMTKPITFVAHITDERSQPVNDAHVTAALTMKVMDMGTTKLNFTSKGNGNYEASINSVDMSGPWNLAVEAAEGNTKVKKDFEITVGD